MKNKVAYLLFFIVAVAATAGCKKSFLEDMKSYEKFDEDMFTSETLTGAYIDRLYNFYFVSYTSPMKMLVGNWESTRGSSTDEMGGVTNFTNPNKQLLLASESDGYIGAALEAKLTNVPYTRIRFANFLIEKIDGGVGQALREDFKKTAKGQMYFMRALQYFDLVRVFGGVPLVLTVQNASSTDETIKLPRAKTSEVFDQIIKDLDSAAALLPKAWPDADMGRLNAPAAIAMKSRVLLTAASPLFNPNWDNPGDAKWQRALDASLAAETYLTAAGYGLNLNNNAKDWSEVTFKQKDKFNGEGIFVIPLSNNAASSTAGNFNGWENSIRLKDYKGGGGISVPKGMIDAFPMADGSRPVIGSNYNDLTFFVNRDPRFYRTFFFPGEKWSTKATANRTSWLYRWRKDATSSPSYATTDNSALLSPVVVRKMSDPAADSTAFPNSGTDIFDFRYGELLLNIAECYAAQGKTAECADYLGKVRKRVYPLSAAANNYGIGVLANRYAALEACLYERRIELAYEGKRFYDLQRWMLYDDDPAINDNTNALLNIAKLNGTARTGYLWEAQNYTNADPLTAAEKATLVDPDNANFQTQLTNLANIVTTKLKMVPTDKPMDVDGTTPVNMLFRSNYYIFGLTNTMLGTDPWLTQTIGWLDYNGTMGTYDYRQ